MRSEPATDHVRPYLAGTLWTYALLAALLAIGTAIYFATRSDDTKAVEGELLRRTQALVDAVTAGNPKAWQESLDERAIYVDEAGNVMSKAEMVDQIKPLPPGLAGKIRVTQFKVQLHSDTAVTTHVDDEHVDYFGQPIHQYFRTTETWKSTGSGWRLIAGHIFAMLKDPPEMRLPKARLCTYNGTYRRNDTAAGSAPLVTIECNDAVLIARREGKPDAIYKAEAPDLFFAPGSPRVRRIFQRDEMGRIVGFADRRESEDIVWKRVS